MDTIRQEAERTDGAGRLNYELTEQTLRRALTGGADPSDFEGMRLDREAAAAFIADHATLLSAVAHAAGLSTVKIVCDLLYVNAFGDAAATEQ